MKTTYIVIAIVVAVVVLVSIYWFVLRSSPSTTTATLSGYNYASNNGNYIWTGWKTAAGDAIFEADRNNLAADQEAVRTCVLRSAGNIMCYPIRRDHTPKGQSILTASGSFGDSASDKDLIGAKFVVSNPDEFAKALTDAQATEIWPPA